MKLPSPNTFDGLTQKSKNHKSHVSKKQKVRTNSSSSDIVHTSTDESLDSTQDLFDTHPDFSLTFKEFKNFFENAKGCTNLSNLCIKYASSWKLFQIFTQM